MSEARPIKRKSTLKAGGGQSSAVLDHQAVTEFSPLISHHLEQLYNTLISSNQKTDSTGPPLSSYNQFLSWFQSPSSSALAPPVNHDLSFPLCNYYISSSHNTYLSGNQLYGAATTEAYTNVLLRGCRCLEIDVWNGQDEASSVSSSDVEDAENEKEAASTKRKQAMSKLKSLKGKMGNEMHSTRSHSRFHSSRSPGTKSEAAYEQDEEVEDITEHLSAAQIAERRAILKTEPRVYHGYTLTKDVPFREVCHAIKESAFKASNLPVIVSLEVHCNLDQQQIMVDIMQEEWKRHLVDVNHQNYDKIEQLPSPDALKEKILIKVKWTPTTDSSESNNPLEITQTNETVDTEASSSTRKRKATKILDTLSKLGVYTRAYSFKHFSQPEAKIPTHVFSLDENKLGHVHADPQHGPDMFHHNQNFLVRIYPSGLRVNSSNIDPAFSWRQGAQMVALNWQRLDKGMMLNEGMFAGEDGYVLKPDGFRSSDVSNQVQPVRRRLNLAIHLVAAQNLPLPLEKYPSHASHMKPYVKFILHVDTHGPPGQGKRDRSDSTADLNSKYDKAKPSTYSAGEEKDEDDRKLKRKSKTGRTNTTDFEAGEMVWTDIPDVVEQLSFLRIKVMDDKMLGKDELAAWACIRLDRLKTGWRFLHLLDVEGSPSEGVLLVHIDKRVH
ncbi:hypothetical protein H2198_004606 [Neophaeococcomyces mojaviensis]|uniref:Uncharacterized protein n=1 Tax=Neophaeococcomyces mojaviensis TaxID=3383035 RepID=A0ACC3A829_9EURO|nr:hypothetical protein H2198_004606 [Knufia sp. JES_112]